MEFSDPAILSAVLGFASGVGVTLVGTIVTSALQRHCERRRRIEAHLFDVYMMLMELQTHYFWVSSCEMNREEPDREILVKVKDLAWRIADKLRAEDRVPYMADVLTVLMCEGTYGTVLERYEAIDNLLGKLGEKANPRYAKLIKEISRSNLAVVPGKPLRDRKAPALLWP